MGRLVNPDGVGKQRDRLMRAVTLALRELAGRNAIDTLTRDLVAFLALALNEVHATIDVTCLAWEKRDYWLKADQFRREWGWAGRMAEKLERVVLGDDWHSLPGLMADLAKHLDKVNLPKRNTLGTPWVGAHARLVAEREAEA
ncbi:MAG: hypothetical protein IT318_19940 [Anaerolineales bacterium]|nr:hypothetical protein [Anaerolineales bacterium]